MSAIEVLQPTLDRLKGQAVADADNWVAGIVLAVEDALASAPTGTMHKWMIEHDGQVVTTIQVHNSTGTAWTPTGRTIDAGTRSSVKLSGSRRDYAGMRVIATTDDVLIVADDGHTIAYVIESSVTA